MGDQIVTVPESGKRLIDIQGLFRLPLTGSARRSRVFAMAAGLAAVCTTMALALTACGTGAGSAARAKTASQSDPMSYLGLHGEPAIGPLQAVTGPNSLHLPLDPYYLNASEQLTVTEAERAAEQACIHRYLPGVGLGTFGRAVILPPPGDPIAYLAPSQAARYGYHDPAVMALAATDKVPLSGAVLTEADEVASGTVHTLNGLPVPNGGCDVASTGDVMHGISPSLIPGQNGNPATLSGVVKLINHVAILNDSRIKAVDAKWSACMASRGYYYARPQIAASNPLWNRRNAKAAYLHPITVAEIQTARADTACRAAVNLYPVYWAVIAAYQRQWMTSAQNMALAQAQGKADQVMLTRAAGILGG